MAPLTKTTKAKPRTTVKNKQMNEEPKKETATTTDTPPLPTSAFLAGNSQLNYYKALPITISSVPGCCGSYFLSGFGYTSAMYRRPTKPQLDATKKNLKDTLTVCKNSRKSVVLAYLNNHQVDAGLEDIFVELGFYKVNTVSNPNMADTTQISLYVYEDKSRVIKSLGNPGPGKDFTKTP